MSEIKDNKDNFENTAFDTEVENLFDEPDASPEERRMKEMMRLNTEKS